MRPFSRIQNKLLVAILIVVLLPLIGTGLYGNWVTSQVLQENALGSAYNQTALQAEQISAFLAGARQDILFLSRLGSLQSLIEARTRSAVDMEHWQQQLAHDFAAFSQERGLYYQVRYITEHGDEFVRVDSNQEAVASIPVAELQNKADRYYFREAARLQPNEVFVSALDLNRERGEIEQPFKPVLRYATPVFDAQGQPRGIVITNIFADNFLQIVRQANSSNQQVWLLDKTGYFMVHPDPEFEWGGPADLDTGQRVHQILGDDIAAQILSGQVGQSVAEDAIVYLPIFPNLADRSDYWVLAHVEPRDTIFASVWNFRVAATSILVLAAAVATAMAIWLARSLTAPIRSLREGVEKYGRGELTAPVDVNSNDEIGELAHTFNQMATDLNRVQNQRQKLIERLINVQEEERRMVAYDIHDGLIQRLVGARMHLSNFVAQHTHKEDEPAEQALERGIVHLSASIVEGRRLIEGLRPSLLDDLGLVPALKELAEQEAAEMNAGLDFSATLTSERLPPTTEITAYRIVQEALNNSRKHSQSTRLRVAMAQQDGWLEITVQDWGVGFDTSCLLEASHRCFGLSGMQERANLVGGEISIKSAPNSGTVVKSRLPIT
ncbi:MAG: hypothetical protein Kow0031_24290 [Anaerolineae bacterium]